MESPEVQMPDKKAFTVCRNPEHWFEVLMNEFCHSCLRGRRDTEDMKAQFDTTPDDTDEDRMLPCPDCGAVMNMDEACENAKCPSKGPEDMSGATPGER